MRLNQIFKILLVFTTIAVVFNSFGQITEKKFKQLSFDEMYAIVQDLKNVEEDFLNIAINKAQKENNEFFIARFELCFSKFSEKNGNYEKALLSAYTALQYANENKEISSLLAECYMRVSLALEGIGDYYEALKYRHLQQSLTKEIEDKSYLKNFIGNIFMNMNETDSARFYYKSYLQYVKQIEDPKKIAFCRNNIGLTFLQENNYDSALYYFQQSQSYYEHDESLGGAKMNSTVLGNIANCNMLQGNMLLAVKYIMLAIDNSEKHNISNYWFVENVLLAKIYRLMGKYQKSLNVLSKLDLDKFMSKKELFVTVLKVHKLKVANHEELGNFQKAYEENMQYQVLYDSLYGKEKLDEMYQLRSRFQRMQVENQLQLKQVLSQQQKEKIKLLEKNAALSRFRILLITLSALITIGVFSFFVYRLKRKNEIERLSKELLEATNESQSQRLTETTLTIARKKEFAQSLKQKISELNGIQASDKSAIKLFVENELQLDDSMLEMEKLIGQLGEEFFVKIKNSYPKLTENDLKLCGLIRLKLTTKQIAIIKSITPESAKVSKNRLSKKLNVPKGTRLYDFLKTI